MLQGIVQWANKISLFLVSIREGLHWKASSFNNFCATYIPSIEGTSPSQVAIMPSSLKWDKAKQAVVLRVPNKSKQRIVKPLKLYFLTKTLIALYKRSALEISFGSNFLSFKES